MKRSLVTSVLLGFALAGCQSYDIVQTNIFSDDIGNVVRIDYGRSDKAHVNTFRSPKNGEKMEFKSHLVVDVILPDGEKFTAWQCMNFNQTGTMYKTDNEDWLVLVGGFACAIFTHDPIPADPERYREIYRGILCESPKSDYKPNPKWRELKWRPDGKWK